MDIEKEVRQQIQDGIDDARAAGVICGNAMDIRIRTDSNEVELRCNGCKYRNKGCEPCCK